jgi:hypothetical protein
MKKCKNHSFTFQGEKILIITESYSDINELNIPEFNHLKNVLNDLLLNCWGTFPSDFIEKHILSTNKIILARVRNKYIGLVGMSIKKVGEIKIHYMEFLLVSRGYQKGGLGSFLSYLIIKEEIYRNIFRLVLGKPLEIFFITPNIRLLAKIAKFASFIYPNPYLANEKGRVSVADKETWSVAYSLLEKSDNPRRRLDREGLVLHGSYAHTPWLIYNNDNAPWHDTEKLNIFAKRYLKYHKGEDREFMVRSHINLISVLKFLFKI